METRNLGQGDAFILLCDAVVASKRTIWQIAADYLVTGQL
jgi:hypothetical protein